MPIGSPSSQEDAILRETATRLIDAVGIESAIFVCRSNYWHGLLHLVLEWRNKSRIVDAGSRRKFVAPRMRVGA